MTIEEDLEAGRDQDDYDELHDYLEEPEVGEFGEIGLIDDDSAYKYMAEGDYVNDIMDGESLSVSDI